MGKWGEAHRTGPGRIVMRNLTIMGLRCFLLEYPLLSRQEQGANRRRSWVKARKKEADSYPVGLSPLTRTLSFPRCLRTCPEISLKLSTSFARQVCRKLK